MCWSATRSRPHVRRPGTGTGTGKVFTDVERLCNVHIPRWFATEGMGADKIAAFYADPVKREYDALSAEKAFHLRSLSVEPGPAWAARRALRFAARLAIGTVRDVRRWLSPERASFSARPPSPITSGTNSSGDPVLGPGFPLARE